MLDSSERSLTEGGPGKKFWTTKKSLSASPQKLDKAPTDRGMWPHTRFVTRIPLSKMALNRPPSFEYHCSSSSRSSHHVCQDALQIRASCEMSYPLLSKPKPSLTNRQIRRHTVPHARSINSLNVWSKVTRHIVRLRGVGFGRRRRLAHSEDIRPLLQLLLVVLGVHGRVCGAMPELHLGPCTACRVRGIHSACDGAPDFGRRCRLSFCAGAVPGVDAVGG